MKLSTPFIGMGMGGGLVVAIYAIGVDVQYAGPVMRIVLPACAAIGLYCASVAYQDVRKRCDRYERLLAAHGIPTNTE
jgi:hypothetical protein